MRPTRVVLVDHEPAYLADLEALGYDLRVREPGHRCRDSYRSLVSAPDVDVLVVEVGGVVRGYLLGFSHLSLVANGVVSWVEEVAVADGFRRHGLGARLMVEFERRARDRGSRFVALATTRGHAFYGAIGYADHASYFRNLL